MVFPGEVAVCLLDLLIVSTTGYAEGIVVIFFITHRVSNPAIMNTYRNEETDRTRPDVEVLGQGLSHHHES
jgi:hypothetical protein